MKELENFQSFRGDTIEHYDPDMGDKDKQQFVDFFSSLNRMPLTRMNSVTLLTDGQEKLDSLLQDLKAKHSIHIEYYAFVTDNIGQQVLHVLEEKAAEGVEVRILYDAFGSHGTKAKDFNRLIKNGGHVHTFVTSQRALLRFRLNYHDHRKIVVIDGKISYTGGFNIANQYVNTTKIRLLARYAYTDFRCRFFFAPASLLNRLERLGT